MFSIQKLKVFAETIQTQHHERLKRDQMTCQANMDGADVSITPIHVKTKRFWPSTVFYRVANLGNSYMVNSNTGEIFGLICEGPLLLPDKSKRFGSLDTIDAYYWGSDLPHLTNAGLSALAAVKEAGKVAG